MILCTPSPRWLILDSWMLCIPHKHLKKLNAHHHVTSAWNVPCSQEIADGVNKSAKVAQAVETGLGQMRDLAMQQATCMFLNCN